VPTNVYAVDPNDPNVIYAATATELFRTDDSGCVWRKIFEMPAASADYREADGAIMSLYLPPHSSGVVYMVFQFSYVQHLMKSDDGGKTWTSLDGNFPEGSIPPALNTLGVQPLFVTGSPSDPNYLYAAVREDGLGHVSSTRVYATTDGGKTWEYRSTINVTNPQACLCGDGFVHLKVDPLDPKDVWAFDFDEIVHSTDGGKTFDQIKGVRTPYGQGANDLDLLHRPGEPTHILVAPYYAYDAPETREVFLSDDGGHNWSTLLVPDEAKSVEYGAKPTTFLVLTMTNSFGSPSTPRLYRFLFKSFRAGAQAWNEITPTQGLIRLQDPKTAGSSYYFRTGDYTYEGENVFYRYDGKV
jgi:hypothetical protein